MDSRSSRRRRSSACGNELSALTRKEIPLELIQRAWTRLRFDDSISRNRLKPFSTKPGSAGFLRAKIDLSNLIWNPR